MKGSKSYGKGAAWTVWDRERSASRHAPYQG